MMHQSSLLRHSVILLSLILASHWRYTVVSLAPPHPDFEDWESVHEMRRRLNINYDYEPVHISAEHCRHVSAERCRELDENHGHRIANRRLNPAFGEKVRVLVLLIEFADNTLELPPREYYEELFNGKGSSDTNPVGSIKEWLRYNSMGKYRVHFDVRDWERVEHDEAFYAQGTSGQGQDLDDIFIPAMTKYDAEGSVNWKDGYVNEDTGFLNHFIVLHSGLQAEVGDRPCIPGSHTDRLWSNGSYEADYGSRWQSQDVYQVNGWVLSSAFRSPVCERNDNTVLKPLLPATMGILVHEISHGFGLPDLYDQGRPRLPVGGIGKFGSMASIQGWDIHGDTPGYLCAYSRARIGWLEPIVIDRDGYYVVQPLEIANSLYQIKYGYNEGEYLYIENKQPIKFDTDVKQGGLVIYHVDEAQNRQSQRGYPGSDGFPTNHYKVAILQADGLYEIEKGQNFGNVGDFWVKGQTLGSGGSHPNTDGYQGGVIKKTGVSIEVMSDSSFIMLIKVSGIGSRSVGLVDKEEGGEDDAHNQNGSSSWHPDGDSNEQSKRNSDSTGQTLNWLLSMLAGVGLMLGLAMIFFV